MPIGSGAPGEYTYDGIWLSKYFPADGLEKIKQFNYRDEDILVVTYPKAGS